MELMTLAKIKNTGRFNYHLKALGDFIEKMNDGRYQLTERGQLAVQLLEKFPEKTGNAGNPTVSATIAQRISGISTKKEQLLPKKYTVAAILVLIIGASFLISFPFLQVSSEKLTVQWQQFLPGVSGSSIIQTSDGGFLALGTNASIQTSLGDGEFVNQQPILTKTDALGKIMWTKTYQTENATLDLSRVIAYKRRGLRIRWGRVFRYNGKG